MQLDGDVKLLREVLRDDVIIQYNITGRRGKKSYKDSRVFHFINRTSNVLVSSEAD